jgi:hypothetical protein
VKNLFEPADRDAILERLARLKCDAARQWGKMACAQALAHCSVALEAGTGDAPRRQALIGKLFAPFVRKGLLGDRPIPRNSPTDPAFIVASEKDFETERKRLIDIVNRFCELGRENAAAQTHSFFGRLTGDEWGRVMYKHIDHHLRQFGA